MDNLTHSLVGALLGQAGLKKKTGLAMPALIIGANLPDVDAACFFWLEGTEHLGFRRGITHGPPAMVLLPLILAGLLWGWDRWQSSRGVRPEGRLPISFKWLFLLSFIGCLTHPALDWLNVYGIRFLEPFSSRWFYGDVLFIIDVWLWALMGFACVFSLRREAAGGDWMKPARIAIAVSLAYIGINGAVTWYQEGVEGDLAEPYPLQVIASPPPLYSWQRERIIQLDDHVWASTAWTGPDIGYGYKLHSSPVCKWPDLEKLREANSQLDAFLFWSRAPFAERAQDGSVIIRDARFIDPLAGDRFNLKLPRVKCEELPTDWRP